MDDQDDEIGEVASVLSDDDRSENGLLNDVYRDFEESGTIFLFKKKFS